MAFALVVLVASLLGSVHCAAMCGAFTCLYANPVERGRPIGGELPPHLAYNLGRLAAYVALGALAGTPTVPGEPYTAIWVADDRLDADADPLVDRNGAISVVARAWGTHGTRRTVEIGLVRSPIPGSGGDGGEAGEEAEDQAQPAQEFAKGHRIAERAHQLYGLGQAHAAKRAEELVRAGSRKGDAYNHSQN